MSEPTKDRAAAFPFRSFLDDVRMRATSKLVVEFRSPGDDPADVHEDVREALQPFFEEIRERVEGPMCKFVVPIGKNTGAACDLLLDHEGSHHPCVGTEVAA